MKNQLLTGDCLELFKTIPQNSVDLAVIDPPYNIGFDYGDGEYKDNLKPSEYQQWTWNWLQALTRLMTPTSTMWVVIGDEWVADMRVAARGLGWNLRSWVIWYYTFGVNSTKKLSRSHAHLLYLVRDPKHFTFNHSQLRVPSARATVYNDKRAHPDGRLPDDTWILRPQAVPGSFKAESDTWTIPRVCGTHKERQDGAANQMPEQLLGRIIRACSNEGDLVLDPMAGTGTTLAVAKKLKRDYIGIELSPRYSEMIRARVDGAQAGDELDGLIPPGG